ncbi:DUF790 family protein [Neorhodopirellula pilleata]|uniref:DUF790 family protein n=1 Tax=Neorhodopirellula pilleata TaxID=2714738 RepID=A0A5C6A1K4_9BACT|nr:DUF790 family protein [Neorhodopirellula pilleata]TWT93131.1 hypothetical protein Pla100_44480 [Neorhodopirellula pilleata]
MLRSEHSLAEIDFRRRTIQPDRLMRERDSAYIDAVDACLNLYRNSIGEARQEIHRGVADVLSSVPGCPPKRIAAFCKLFDDSARYEANGRAASALRCRVFEAASPLHPIVSQREGIFEHDLASARQIVCEAVGLSWPEIESRMFADVIELQRLQEFDDKLTPIDWLSAYNMAQTQAALYRATSVRIDAWSDFKTIARHAKLARLMHRIDKIDRPEPGFRFQLDGAGSCLRETTRYGIGFAKLLPKLLTCRRWQLSARVLGPNHQVLRLDVSPKDRLRSPLQPEDDFDSEFERQVDAAWQRNPPPAWRLERESELLVRGQTVLTPDFVLRHDDGRKIFLEVIGFWTPEYLRDKSERMRGWLDGGQQDRRDRWLLMFPKKPSERAEKIAEVLTLSFLLFDPKQAPSEWIAAVESKQ